MYVAVTSRERSCITFMFLAENVNINVMHYILYIDVTSVERAGIIFVYLAEKVCSSLHIDVIIATASVQ